MSGGHFVHSSYPYYRVFEFADELEAELANNDHEYDGYKRGYSAAVIERLRQVVADARRVAGELKAADYLYSGDTGEESFLREVGVVGKLVATRTLLDEQYRLYDREVAARIDAEDRLVEHGVPLDAPPPEAAPVAQPASASLEDQARAFLASLPPKEEAPTYRPGGSLACDHPRIALVRAQAGIQTARADVDDLSRALATSAVALAADFEETLRRLQVVEGELTLLRAKTSGDAETMAEADLHIRHFGWPLEKVSFRRGAEAMRHALLQRVDWHGSTADRIRAEPVPEDEP